MKKNTSWKFTDESSVTFQLSVSGPGEFGLGPRSETKWPFVYFFFFFHGKIHNIPASFKCLAFSILWQTWMSDTDEMPQSCQRMISQIGNVWQVLAISWIFVGHTELCNNSSLIWQQQRASSFTLCPFSFNNSTIWLGLHLVLMSDCGYVLHNQIEVFLMVSSTRRADQCHWH